MFLTSEWLSAQKKYEGGIKTITFNQLSMHHNKTPAEFNVETFAEKKIKLTMRVCYANADMLFSCDLCGFAASFSLLQQKLLLKNSINSCFHTFFDQVQVC